jgi:hypothetical protein
MSSPVAGAALDGSAPTLCALIRTFDCEPGADCQQGAAESVNLPDFIKIDFRGKTISTTGDGDQPKVTTIRHLEQGDDGIILQGLEETRAWSMVIAKKTGRMTATVSGHQVAFAVFGACTPF